MPDGGHGVDAIGMLIIEEATGHLRLACESCGAQTTPDPMRFMGIRPQEECAVCGIWERIRPSSDCTHERPLVLN